LPEIGNEKWRWRKGVPREASLACLTGTPNLERSWFGAILVLLMFIFVAIVRMPCTLTD